MMLKTYLYIPPDLQKRIIEVAKEHDESRAEIMRLALDKGLQSLEKYKSSADGLLKVADLGAKYKVKGPKDLSTNLDKYLWEDDHEK